MDPHPLQARHQRVAEAITSQGLDGLVVTNLANIRYLTGFSGTAGLLLVTPARLYLVVDFRYSAAVLGLIRERTAPPGLVHVPLEASTGYDRRFVALVAEVSDGATGAGSRGELGTRRLGFEASHVPVARWRLWETRLSEAGVRGVELVDTDRVVERTRERKDALEIELLREGGRRLSQVARDVLDDVVRSGRTELEISADIDWRLKRAGFEKPAFDTIVASGPNSALPHARPTARRVAGGDLVVLDFGGVHGGYCVDLTRTVAVGSVSAECRRIYDAVLEAQEAAIAAARREQVETGEVDRAARETLRRHGLDQVFGHGTGHGLGLDVHEAPRLGQRTEDSPGRDLLQPGMVFTIEPGAYVEGLGGVRIEDDLLRTETGCDLLTDVPRQWRTIPA
jgi:Xaa-Pro aminopeptidase